MRLRDYIAVDAVVNWHSVLLLLVRLNAFESGLSLNYMDIVLTATSIIVSADVGRTPLAFARDKTQAEDVWRTCRPVIEIWLVCCAKLQSEPGSKSFVHDDRYFKNVTSPRTVTATSPRLSTPPLEYQTR